MGVDEITEKLNLAVDNNVITSEQVEPLLDLFKLDKNVQMAHGTFDFSHLSWVVGVVLLMFSFAILLVYVEQQFGQLSSSLTLFAYGIFFYVTNEILYKNEIRFFSALLLISSILVVPVAVYLLLDLYVENEVAVINLALGLTVVYSVGAIVYRQFPLLIIILYSSLIGLIINNFDLGFNERYASTWFVIGWVTLALSWVLNNLSSHNFPFWLNKFAALQLGFGSVIFINNDIVSIGFLYSSVLLLLVSLYLRYQSFIFTALTGLITYLNYLVFDLYSDSLLFFFFLILGQASIILFVGVKAYKNKEDFNILVEQVLPDLLVKYRPKPLKEPLSYGYSPVGG